MKRIALLALAITIACGVATAQPRTQKFTEHFEQPQQNVRYEVPIAERYTSAVVSVNGVEVASQVDNIPGVGRVVAFEWDAVKGRNTIKISCGKGAQKEYPRKVWAQMYYKNKDKSLRKIDFVEEGADTMYNRLHHHGPAFENSEVAYRLYFDKKQTVDIYGKRHQGLEIAQTMWYPTDEHLAAGAGDDVLRVSGTVGVGTLKGWDAKKGKATHIDKFSRRVARIIADGPVRTVVEMSVEGWNYCGDTLSLQSVYTLWGGSRECSVKHTLGGEWSDKTFCTGVQKKFRDREPYITDRAIAVWAEDFPQNDTIKYKKERVGLVVWPADGEVDGCERVEDKDNYLCLVRPNSKGEICYSFSYVWLREEFEAWSKEAFFRYVDHFHAEEVRSK